MLRIAKLTDYALLIMGQMAKSPLTILSATCIADALHLSAPTVSKILKILAEADLVTSVRGAGGGYQLARPANEITVADVINGMEGEVAMTECCHTIRVCAFHTQCTMKENWQKINKMINSLLTGVTLSDMLQPLSLANHLIDRGE